MALLTVDAKAAEATVELHADELERRLSTFRVTLAHRLQHDLLEEAELRHAIARSDLERIRAFPTSSTSVRVGVFGVAYARAADRGAFIVPKGSDVGQGRALDTHGKVLRFEKDGEVLYRRFARLKPTHFFEAALHRAPLTVARTFDRQYDLRHAHGS